MPEVLNVIDTEMEKKDELTAPKLRKKLQEQFGINFSESKVKRLRQKLGWVQTGMKYCQLIREANCAKRLEFCLECVEDNEKFDDVIFTDECSIHMEKYAKLCFRRRWEQPRLKGQAKHPFKVHIWASISKRGPTRVSSNLPWKHGCHVLHQQNIGKDPSAILRVMVSLRSSLPARQRP